MRIGGAEFARMYGDPDDDYNSFAKCVVRSIDALDQLAEYLDDYITDADAGSLALEPALVENLRSQKAACIALRDTLREWGLGIPHIQFINRRPS